MVILGASGSGKSSFMRAGLLPRMERDDRHFTVLPPVRPERGALYGEAGLVTSLCDAFAHAHKPKNRATVRKAVEAGGETLRAMLRELSHTGAHAAPGDTHARGSHAIVLPVDQAEALFAAEAREEAETFLALFRDLLEDDDPAVIGMITIRSDNYERLQTEPALEGIKGELLSLPPMPVGAYGEVIRGPARRLTRSGRKLELDDKLVEALMSDIEKGGSKDALPLLAFTLERLYADYGDDGDLTLAEYEDLGGIRGSINAAVERVLARADTDPRIPSERKALLTLLRRGLIPWLAGIDPDTGTPRRRVARLSEIPAEARPLMDLLVEERLLSTDVDPDTRETTIEPAHEALLRQWGRLEGWLEEDLRELSAIEGVRRAARDWAANAKNPQWLAHVAGRLEDAEAAAEREDLRELLQPTDRAYLAAAREAEDRRIRAEVMALRRQRMLAMVGGRHLRRGQHRRRVPVGAGGRRPQGRGDRAHRRTGGAQAGRRPAHHRRSIRTHRPLAPSAVRRQRRGGPAPGAGRTSPAPLGRGALRRPGRADGNLPQSGDARCAARARRRPMSTGRQATSPSPAATAR